MLKLHICDNIPLKALTPDFGAFVHHNIEEKRNHDYRLPVDACEIFNLLVSLVLGFVVFNEHHFGVNSTIPFLVPEVTQPIVPQADQSRNLGDEPLG